MAERLDQEKFLRRIEALALSTLPIRELPLVAAPPEHYDGVMVALVPDEPEQFALDSEDALPADDLHVSLCLFGKVQDLSSFDKTKILAKTRSVCDSVGRSFSTNVDGVVVMGKNDDDVPATAMLIQSDEIVTLYDALADALDYESKFPTFIPHMTAGYGVPTEDVESLVGQPISFSKVIVKFGDAIHEIPLSAALTAAQGANVIDRVIDSLGRLWDEALHPRDAEGKFIKKNGAISGKLAVPTRDRKGVNMVDANRASVVGFHTFGNDVWVLAEITNQDGSTTQGFARASTVSAVAPVKARLDALYPIDDHGDAFIDSSLERKRQLDLILAHITSEFGPDNDGDGAMAFLESLGLWEKDLDYIFGGENDVEDLGGIRHVERTLSDEERLEQEDIIKDARTVKELRDRVHGLKEDAERGFSAEDAHTTPKQKLLTNDAPDPDVIAALDGGADPFSLTTNNLLGAMHESKRFKQRTPTAETGVSPIDWIVDPSDRTKKSVRLAGTGSTSMDRAYFVKQSIIGAELGNTDIVNEVTASLIAENVAEAIGSDDARLLKVPRSVFGDNPAWDGATPPGSNDPWRDDATHQPAHVISQHAEYLIPTDWKSTDAVAEETKLRNDIRDLDEAAQVDQTAAFYEDIGDVYGNSITKMVLWDFAILNGDRNPGNAILSAPVNGSEGVVLPIDHGFAFDEPYTEGDAQQSFDWFMMYPITKAWLNYVRGGLDLNNNVSEESLRQMIQDFSDTYGRMDVEQIVAAFSALPGVSTEQIDRVGESVNGVLDRIQWIGHNMDAVLKAITERTGT